MLVKSKTEDVKPSIKDLDQPEFRNKFLTIFSRKSREFPRLIIPKVKLPSTLISRANLTAQSTETSFKREPTDISDFENHNDDDLVDCNDAQESHYEEEEPEANLRTRQNAKVKHAQELLKCRFCNLRLSTRFNQRRHEVHCNSDRVRHKKKVLKIYECDLCDTKLKSKDALVKHKGIHTGVKPFQCSICQKRFRERFDLKRHEAIHSKPKITPNYKYSESQKQKLKHKCKVCGKRFKAKQNWLAHERIHTGEKPFSCRYCGRKFNYKPLLRNHELIHKRRERKTVVKQEEEVDAEHKSGENTPESNTDSRSTGNFEQIRVRIVSSLNVLSESPNDD